MLGSDSHHCAINRIIMSFWLADYGLGGEEEEGGGRRFTRGGGEGEKWRKLVCELRMSHPAGERTLLKQVATASAQLFVYY